MLRKYSHRCTMRKLHNKLTRLISGSSSNEKLHHSPFLELLLTFQLHSKDLDVILSYRRVLVGDRTAAEFGVSEPTLLFCSEGRLGVGNRVSGLDEFVVWRRYASLGLVNWGIKLRHPSICKPGRFWCFDVWYYLWCHSTWCLFCFCFFSFFLLSVCCLFACFPANRFRGFSGTSPTKLTWEVLRDQNVNNVWLMICLFLVLVGVIISSCSPLHLKKFIRRWPTWSPLELFTVGQKQEETDHELHIAHYLKVATFHAWVMCMVVVN